MFMVKPSSISSLGDINGQRFTEFMNSLIIFHGRVFGLKDSDISSNLATTIPDGGVDTEVKSAFSNDSTGYFSSPTIWQYKTGSHRRIYNRSLDGEIGKDYVRQRIRDGYGYRLCVNCSLTPNKMAGLKDHLTSLLKAINSDSPPVIILDSNAIALWANRYPALIQHVFYGSTVSIVYHIDAFREIATTSTNEFVPIHEWFNITSLIRNHIDFSSNPPEVLLSIQGMAGVGKTRVVYEVVSSFKGSEGLVLYTDDDRNALKIANILLNNATSRAILIADECSVDARVRIKRVLNNCCDRVRIIAIDNSGERPIEQSSAIWMESITPDAVSSILEKNFPQVPANSRATYAELSEGFIRLAADLCRFDSKIANAGEVTPVFQSVWDYLRTRLSKEELRIIMLLSLFSKVGFRDDVSDELDHICQISNIERSIFNDVAKKLHDVPGFVGLAGRYYYVTPEIIAHVAFAKAWEKWVSDNPDSFLKNLPSLLLESFNKRISASATREVRKLVGTFFQQWALDLIPDDLSDINKIEWLVTLTEISPNIFLPIIRDLINDATNEQLLNMKGSANGRWGSRRLLIWFLEKIVAFPDYFDDSESILLALAVNETEQDIGNNATSIWRQIYRVVLSGTPLPFEFRLLKIKGRLFSSDRNIVELALSSVEESFSPFSTRTRHPALLAGRIAPPEWNPRTTGEKNDCLRQLSSLLAVASGIENDWLSKGVQKIALNNMRNLLSLGCLNDLRSIFNLESLSEEARAEVFSLVDGFLKDHSREDEEVSRCSSEYVEEIERWHSSLEPTSFHGEIVSLISCHYWDRTVYRDNEAWILEISKLARNTLEIQEVLKEELEWLCSEHAKSADMFGRELGKLDAEGIFVDEIFESVCTYQSASLARGYVKGCLEANHNLFQKINSHIDRILEEEPILAFELFVAGGDSTDALNRALGLVDSGKMPAYFLQSFQMAIGTRRIASPEYYEVLRRLVSSAKGGDIGSFNVAIDMVTFALSDGKSDEREDILNNNEIRKLMWNLVEIQTTHNNRGYRYWNQVYEILYKEDPNRFAKIAAKGLVSESFEIREGLKKIMIDIAVDYASIVMKHIGRIGLNEDTKSHFYFEDYRSIIEAIDPNVVIEWVKHAGVEGARILARHLPRPYINEENSQVVPKLTEFILKEYEEDDRVFQEFSTGIHGIRSWWGNIADMHRQDLELANQFLSHPLRRIKEWAKSEAESSQILMERAQQRHDEEYLE